MRHCYLYTLFTLFLSLSMPVLPALLLAWMVLAPTFSKLLGPPLRLSTSLVLRLLKSLALSVSVVRHALLSLFSLEACTLNKHILTDDGESAKALAIASR